MGLKNGFLNEMFMLIICFETQCFYSTSSLVLKSLARGAKSETRLACGERRRNSINPMGEHSLVRDWAAVEGELWGREGPETTGGYSDTEEINKDHSWTSKHSGNTGKLDSTSGFRSVLIMGTDYPFIAGCPGQVIFCPLFNVLQSIKWNRFSNNGPSLLSLIGLIGPARKKHWIDWFYNPNNPIRRLSSASLSLTLAGNECAVPPHDTAERWRDVLKYSLKNGNAKCFWHKNLHLIMFIICFGSTNH